MITRMLFLFLFFFVSTFPLVAQADDPILFTVENTPIHRSEFLYIYTKTNGKQADFSKKSLEEYLELYIKFKLKVQRAKEMQLDTIPQLKQELAGYRRQLADSYLIDKEVTDKLVQEAYERIKQDVEISHILINLRPNATPTDTVAAYQKIKSIKERLEKGEDFTAVAKATSNDRSAQRNGGKIGYIKAVLPNGLYNLENAAYSLPLGQLTGPIRTDMGYHLLIIHNRRPARGEIEAAHILLRKKGNNGPILKAKIDSIYQVILKENNFDLMTQQFSEDKTTANKKGYIGFFGIGRYDPIFEDAAFALQKDGDISKPFETQIGWHIVKRISRKGIQPYEIEKSRLETKIKKDGRFEKAQKAMVARIKAENNFQQDMKVLDKFIATLTDTFLTFRWKAPVKKSSAQLFSLANNSTTLGEFTDYLGRASRQRIRMGRSTDLKYAVYTLYDNFVVESCFKFEESQLEKKYPDFKSLMREYEEGILLFEATKMLVWDKASQDTTGLKKFFEGVRGKFRWTERAKTSTYRVGLAHKNRIEEIRAYAKNHSSKEVLAKFNTDTESIVTVTENAYEKGRFPDKEVPWEVGQVSSGKEVEKLKVIQFFKIEELLPVANKTLKEARGYVVADYQDYLEALWVKKLRKQYKVKINQKVFKGMIR